MAYLMYIYILSRPWVRLFAICFLLSSRPQYINYSILNMPEINRLNYVFRVGTVGF